MNACRARDYGIHQLYWNGEKLGAPIDFYDPELKWQQVKLGKVRVTGGTAAFTAECGGIQYQGGSGEDVRIGLLHHEEL